MNKRVKENRMGNQKWTIRIYWQHWAHKAQNENQQNTKTQHNTEN